MAPELLAQMPREERAQPVSATTSVREVVLCSSSNTIIQQELQY